MKTIEISKALKPSVDYTKGLDDIISLTSGKNPVAAIVSLLNIDKESLSLSSNPEFMAIIEKSRREFKADKKISLNEMKHEISSME